MRLWKRGGRASGREGRWLGWRPDGWFLGSALAGCVWALAYPPTSWAWCGWLVAGLLAMPAWRLAPGRCWRLGWVAGWLHYLLSLLWLLWMPFPSGAVAAWLALSAYLALYPACWLAWLRWLAAAWSGVDAVGRLRLGEVSWGRRQAIVWMGAAGWTALEWVRGWMLTGFPWNGLGVSQVENLPVIQAAAVVGSGGVSFLVAWVGLSLAAAAGVGLERWRRGLEKPGSPRWLAGWTQGPLKEAGPALAALIVVVSWGGWRVMHPAPVPRVLRVALVQPAIPQRLIFNPAEAQGRFEQLLQLTDAALETHPDLLVWPEAALPVLSAEDYRRLYRRIQEGRVWMVFGADDVRPVEGEPGRYEWFNAAFLVDPQGAMRGVYHKRRLVIFGEYVPLEKWLPFLKMLTPIEGSFSAGREAVRFRMNRPPAEFGVLICFEDVFPGLARQSVGAETDFLLNLTNDGWFGESAAHWQHLANATMRAVENGVPLVRCANNGISGWVSARGAWRELGFGPGSRVYEAGFKVVEVPLRGGQSDTLYHRWGDWFSWVAVGLSVVGGGVAWQVGRRGRPSRARGPGSAAQGGAGRPSQKAVLDQRSQPQE